VRACVCVCACLCVFVCVCVCERARACVCVSAVSTNEGTRPFMTLVGKNVLCHGEVMLLIILHIYLFLAGLFESLCARNLIAGAPL